ncbi:MAG: hydrogenase iron-sulfur subunit [Anaerolineae bacterium]|nr:hydrogenase iron-sulfur subunit [Anaerolineae bacterium]
MSETFEPRIVAFMCNWCSYAGADNAGISRLPSPPNVLPIRVMCSGRVSPEMVLRAFRSGADGVMVLGCHIGDCHYIDGNHRTIKRMPLVRNLLGYVGINPERFVLDWVSSAEAPKFARVTNAFVEKIRDLGPIADELGGGA